jgi:hypothetical protein
MDPVALLRNPTKKIISNADFCEEIDYINEYKKAEKTLGIP